MVAGVVNWVLTHKLVLIELYFAIVGVASLVIKLTPTVKDDAFLKKFLKFTGKFIALNKTITAKEQKLVNAK